MQQNMMCKCFNIFLNIIYMLDKKFLVVEHLENEKYILEIKKMKCKQQINFVNPPPTVFNIKI